MKTKWERRFFSKKLWDYSSIEILILSRMVVFLALLHMVAYSLRKKILKFFFAQRVE